MLQKATLNVPFFELKLFYTTSASFVDTPICVAAMPPTVPHLDRNHVVMLIEKKGLQNI